MPINWWIFFLWFEDLVCKHSIYACAWASEMSLENDSCWWKLFLLLLMMQRMPMVCLLVPWYGGVEKYVYFHWVCPHQSPRPRVKGNIINLCFGIFLAFSGFFKMRGLYSSLCLGISCVGAHTHLCSMYHGHALMLPKLILIYFFMLVLFSDVGSKLKVEVMSWVYLVCHIGSLCHWSFTQNAALCLLG
jgi:hypothetical protein